MDGLINMGLALYRTNIFLILLFVVSCTKTVCPECIECQICQDVNIYKNEIEKLNRQIIALSTETILLHEGLVSCEDKLDYWQKAFDDKPCYCAEGSSE